VPFTPGFNFNEAINLLTMSAVIEGVNTLPLPLNWQLIFDSPVFPPFDGKWQLWHNTPGDSGTGAYAIVVRGTVDNVGSILEDLISFLALATGSVTVGGVAIDYKFAADPKASVHVGFALGTLLLLKFPFVGILAQLAAKVPQGSKIYITGHSQGAASATLLRSYLHYGADRPTKNYSYKTYAFAQPKPGNDHYATDFESLFCNTGLAFRVTNSLDWVPQGPFTIEIPSDFNVPNPLTVQTVVDSTILTTLTALQGTATALIVPKVKADLQPTAVALARTKVPTAVDIPFDIPIAFSLNFVGAATEIALIGTPCAGTQCNDFFFEHHATTYYALMQAQLK
jgi:Lipase (class 3)